MDNKKPYPITNFRGGYAGNISPDQLSLQQASDLDNIVINIQGTGIRSRLGNAKVNTGGTLNSGATIQGFGELLTAAGLQWGVTVAGSKIYSSSNIGTSWSDVTGSVTITSAAANLWDLFTFQDTLLGFGGAPTSPDAPFQYTGTGNASALGGTSPSAYGGFSANNRVFAFRTSANPSTIYWSIIGSATDWAGAGSGSAVIGSFSDNQKVTAALVISTNYVIVFKENSTYQMVITTAPFPVYSLFDSVGCVGKKATVLVNGTVYFISPRKRMYSTNGEDVKEYPNTADNLWNSVDTSTIATTVGFRQKGVDYDWIVWLVKISGTTRAIVWDILNECWLRHTTGYKMNVAGLDHTGQVYMGGTDGFIYKPDQATTYADASESSPGTITAYWRSGWINPSSQDEVVQVRKVTANYATRASGNVTIKYGFDFVPDTGTITLSQVATGSEALTSRQAVVTGRGNYFQFLIQQSSSTIDMSFSTLLLRGKVYGQKKISAS